MFTNFLRLVALLCIGGMTYLYWPQIEDATEDMAFKMPSLETVKSGRAGATTNAAYRAPTPKGNSAPFPSVLKQSNWIYSYAGTGACASKPEEQWSFKKGATPAGFQCRQRKSIGGEPVYNCGRVTSKRRYDYIVKSGNAFIGDVESDRPHVTLERVDRPSQKVGLKLCFASDAIRSYSNTLAHITTPKG